MFFVLFVIVINNSAKKSIFEQNTYENNKFAQQTEKINKL